MSKIMLHGIHAVQTAIQNDTAHVVCIYTSTESTNPRLLKLLEEARSLAVNIIKADDKALERLSKTHNHQHIVAEYQQAESYTEKDLLTIIGNLNKPALLLVLDGVTDPHNLGACLRTAEAAAVDAVIVPKDNSVGLTPTVRKVASGAADLVPLVKVTNLSRTLQTLKKEGVWIMGTSDKAKINYFQQDFTAPMALVMGAEGAGMRRLTEKQCDVLLSLPMAGKISSLNISVATGVCLYEANRQRQK